MNSLLNLSVKEFHKSVSILQSYVQNIVAAFSRHDALMYRQFIYSKNDRHYYIKISGNSRLSP